MQTASSLTVNYATNQGDDTRAIKFQNTRDKIDLFRRISLEYEADLEQRYADEGAPSTHGAWARRGAADAKRSPSALLNKVTLFKRTEALAALAASVTDDVVRGAALHARALEDGEHDMASVTAAAKAAALKLGKQAADKRGGFEYTTTIVPSGISLPVPMCMTGMVDLGKSTSIEAGATISNAFLAGMLEAWPEPKQVVERWVVGSAKAGEPKETGKVMRERLVALNGGPVMEMLCDESGAARTAPWRGRTAFAAADADAAVSVMGEVGVVAVAVEEGGMDVDVATEGMPVGNCSEEAEAGGADRPTRKRKAPNRPDL